MTNSNTLIVGQSQQRPSPLAIDDTLNQLANTASRAQDWGVQLLVLPEMSVTGYNLTPHELSSVAEKQNGKIFDTVANLCQRHQISIVYGYAETDDSNRFFNSAQLIDHNGISQLNYRKTHLWGDLDQTLFSPGDKLSTVVEIQEWKVGAAICYDVEFPETLRHLAINGAEVAVIPTGLMTPWREVAERVLPVRAYENRMYVVYTNYCGTERDLTYEGYSCIADPTGNVLASAKSSPVLLTATLEKTVLEKARNDLPYLTQRRPELYSDLT